MTYAIVAASFGNVSDAASLSPLVGQAFFVLGAAILVVAVMLLARSPDNPARYAAARRR